MVSGKMKPSKASRIPDSIDNDRYTGIFTDMKEGKLRSMKPLRYNGELFIFS